MYAIWKINVAYEILVKGLFFLFHGNGTAGGAIKSHDLQSTMRWWVFSFVFSNLRGVKFHMPKRSFSIINFDFPFLDRKKKEPRQDVMYEGGLKLVACRYRYIGERFYRCFDVPAHNNTTLARCALIKGRKLSVWENNVWANIATLRYLHLSYKRETFNLPFPSTHVSQQFTTL